MRILHVIYDDIDNPWLGGGGATRTLEIYSRIVSAGHTVQVICGNYPGAVRREIRRGVRYLHLGVSRPYVLSRVTFAAVAARLIKRGGYDIVIEDVSPFSPVASPIWKRADVPAVASVQNLSGKHASSKYGIAGWGPRLVEKPLLSRFTNFIAVSPGIAQSLRRILGTGRNIRVIPNSVDPVFFGQAPERGAPVKRPYILSLGRIDIYQKGLDRLLDAYEIIAGGVSDVRLVIAGGGVKGQEDKLRALVRAMGHAARVELTGPVSTSEAAALLQGASLLAMPSRYEAWPLSALEAGAAGVPVVGSDIMGVRDAAPAYPRGHGVLVPEGDAPALASAMVKVLLDPARRSEIGARGREWAANYTWDSLAHAQLEFYSELVAGKASTP
jgi:glycogen synthase